MAVLNKSDPVCGRLKQSINNGSSTNGNANVDSNSHGNAVGNLLIIWQLVAIIGWLVIFGIGLGSFMRKRGFTFTRKRGNSRSYKQPTQQTAPHPHPHPHTTHLPSLGEIGTMTMDVDIDMDSR
eukprot:899403_1